MKLLNRFPVEPIQFPSLQVCRKGLDSQQLLSCPYPRVGERSGRSFCSLSARGTHVRPETNRTEISCVVLINDLIAVKVLNKQEAYLNDCKI